MFNYLKKITIGDATLKDVIEGESKEYWAERNKIGAILNNVSEGSEGLDKARNLLKEVTTDNGLNLLSRDLMTHLARRIDAVKELKEKVNKIMPEFEVKFDPEGDMDESNVDFDFTLSRWNSAWGSYESIKIFKTREEAKAYIKVIKKEEAIDAS